jgi:aspartyl-tRNA(Asn)/glutamyl-tRNA(Gln) amidotransferase subunit C
MRAVDTKGIAPLAHPFDIIQEVSLRLMEDQVTEMDNRSANQQTAPSVESGLFLVPKVIE